MERFFPEWKKVIKTMTKTADQAESNPVKPAEASQPEINAPKAVKRTTATKKK
jgi:hypothetical protein